MLPHPQSWCSKPVRLLLERLLKGAGSSSVSSPSKTNTLLALRSPKMSCRGVQGPLCTLSVHLVSSTRFTLPKQGVRANAAWTSAALWVSVTGLWFGHDANLKGQLKIRAAWQVSGELCAIILLANNFLHLNRHSVHRRWAPTPHSPLSASFSVPHQGSLSLTFICCPFN